MRSRRVRLAVLALVATVVVGAFIWAAFQSDPAPYQAGKEPTPRTPMTYNGPSGSATDAAWPSFGPGGGVLGSQTVTTTSGCKGPLRSLPSGPGRSGYTQKHTVTVRASSTGPIPQFALWIPTASLWMDGICATSSLNKTFTVWGPGPYAQFYVRADPAGPSVSCSVAVDGVVKAARTATSGQTQACIA